MKTLFSNWCEHCFSLTEKKTTIGREVVAGFTTFSTMAYIVVVNPMILQHAGMDESSVLFATIGATIVGTLYMSLIANYPFAVAPGMGLNAYFTYGIVLNEGYSWQEALAACFAAGCIFFFLNVTGIRALIMNHIPKSIRLATTAGIGLLLAFIGLQTLGIIVPNENTLIGLGDLRHPTILLASVELIVMSILFARNFPGSILLSIILSAFVGSIFGFAVWEGFFSFPPSPLPTLFALDLRILANPFFLPIILSFVFIALFDATATLLCLAEQGHFLDRQGKFPRLAKALFGDTLGTLSGSLLGTSPSTTFLESSSGIAVGGRTGLTSFIVAVLFGLSLFLSPFITSIPSFATAPVLVFIGALMLQSIHELEWHDLSEFIPAFLIIVAIPLTYNIAWGFALGFMAYPLIKLGLGKGKEISWVVWVLAVLFGVKIFL